MPKRYRTLLMSPSTAHLDMPYNWNWQRRWTQVGDFLNDNPVVLMDVGARGDAPPELESMMEYVLRVGFEPDEEECRRLNESGVGRFFPNLVAGAAGPLTLNLYRDPAQSSALTINERYRKMWTGDMPIERTATIDAVTLDDFLGDHPEFGPDLLKLDVQGLELDILQGSEKSIDSIGLADIEVSFLEVYNGQPLFGDISEFMLDHGFELLWLNRCMSTRTQLFKGPSRGQLLFGDALFGRREDALDAMTTSQLTKYAILLCQYGHMDVAWQLMEAHPEIERTAPGIRSVFKKSSNVLFRGALMQLDKLYTLGLHARRYNQRGMDNDRAWPVR